jgi:hypothetical protein
LIQEVRLAAKAVGELVEYAIRSLLAHSKLGAFTSEEESPYIRVYDPL